MPKVDPTSADQLAQLLVNAPTELQEELKASLWRAACGIRLWTGGRKKPGGKTIGGTERQAKLIYLDTGEEELGYVYSQPPDIQAGKLLLEHGCGRPAVRETKVTETAIVLKHMVPGRRDRGVMPADTPEPEVLPVADDVIEVGGEMFGIGSLIRPDPEDDVADE